MNNKIVLQIASAVFFFSIVSAYAASAPTVGSVTAVKKDVNVVHPGEKQPTAVKKADAVLFGDLYETGPGSRAKLLFADDSIITMGEKTKITITEQIYDPSKDQRSTVVNMVSGKARALVGKAFTGSGSKFEVHTPTAVAAARGTYFIVWVFEQDGKLATGVWSSEGKLDVTGIASDGSGTVLGTVQVGNNQATIIVSDTAPTAAAVPDAAMINDLLSGTALDEQVEETVSTELTEPDPESLPEPEVVDTAVGGDAAGGEGSDSADAETAIDTDEGADSSPASDAPPIDQQPETPMTDITIELNFK